MTQKIFLIFFERAGKEPLDANQRGRGEENVKDRSFPRCSRPSAHTESGSEATGYPKIVDLL